MISTEYTVVDKASVSNLRNRDKTAITKQCIMFYSTIELYEVEIYDLKSMRGITSF